jgi:hypothetical protein
VGLVVIREGAVQGDADEEVRLKMLAQGGFGGAQGARLQANRRKESESQQRILESAR